MADGNTMVEAARGNYDRHLADELHLFQCSFDPLFPSIYLNLFKGTTQDSCTALAWLARRVLTAEFKRLTEAVSKRVDEDRKGTDCFQCLLRLHRSLWDYPMLAPLQRYEFDEVTPCMEKLAIGWFKPFYRFLAYKHSPQRRSTPPR